MKKVPVVQLLLLTCIILAIISTSLVMGVSRCAGTGAYETAVAASPQQAPLESAAAAGTIAGIPPGRILSSSATIVSWAGYGSDRRPLTITGGGTFLATATNTGHANFMARITDRTGTVIATIFDEIGPYDGNNTLYLHAGTYSIDILSDGSWTLTLARM
jgi:hypothetical protein